MKRKTIKRSAFALLFSAAGAVYGGPMEFQLAQTAHKLPFLMVQSSDHITPLTGASPTVQISKDNNSFVAPSGAIAELGSGWYTMAGNAVDEGTLGPLLLHATAASGDPSDTTFKIVGYNPDVAFALPTSPMTLAATQSNVTLSGVLITGTGTLSLVNSTMGLVNSVTTTTNLTTNNDKTGYSLTQSFPTNFSSLLIDTSGRMSLAPTQTNTTFAGVLVSSGQATLSALNVTLSTFTTLQISGGGDTSGFNSTGTSTINANLLLINGAGLNTASAQLGVNVVNIAGTGAVLDGNGYLKTDIQDILGTISQGTAGWMGPDWAAVDNASHAVNLSATTLQLVNILTTYTNNTPQTGDAYAIVNSATFGNSKLVRSTTPGNALTVDGSGDITFNNASIGSVTGNVGGNLVGSVLGTVTLGQTQGAVNFTGLLDLQSGFQITGGAIITNSGGDGLDISSTGANGVGVSFLGNNTGDGFKISGGANGNGLDAIGGATGGIGLLAKSTASSGALFEAMGGNNSGLNILGNGSGVGIQVAGGTTGRGMTVAGGGISGAGIYVSTSGGDAVDLFPTNGNALSLQGNGSGNAGLTMNFGTAGVLQVNGGFVTSTFAGNLTGDVLGHSGLDWSRIANPSSAENLSATTIALANSLSNSVTLSGSQPNITFSGLLISSGQGTLSALNILGGTLSLGLAQINSGGFTFSFGGQNTGSLAEMTTDFFSMVTNPAVQPTVFTVASLVNAPSGSGATPAAIAAAVWQDTTAGDFSVPSSPGNVINTELSNMIIAAPNNAFTYTPTALKNAPRGGP